MNLKPITSLVQRLWEEGHDPEPIFVLVDTRDGSCGQTMCVLHDGDVAQATRENLELDGVSTLLLKFEVVARRTHA